MKVAVTFLYIEQQVTHYITAKKCENSYYSCSYGDKFPISAHFLTIEKVAKQFILTKCSICNSFQVTSDFTH